MILVTGATGTLGAHLLYQLLQSNDKIVALKRENSNTDNVKTIFSFYTNEPEKLFEKIEWRNADISNYIELKDAFENITKVFHCAGYVSFKNKKQNLYAEVNTTGTANIVNLSLEFNIEKLCHVSSIATIGTNNKIIHTEKDDFNPEQAKTFYSLTKYYGELEVWRGIEEGLNAVIVNPSVIIAPYLLDDKVVKFLKFFAKKGIKYFTLGKKSYIDVNDLAHIMIFLMESEIKNNRFIVSAGDLSFKDIIDIFNRNLNKPESKKQLRKSTFRTLNFLNNITSLGNPVINKNIIRYALFDEIYSAEKLKKNVNFEFKSLEKSFTDIIKIYQSKYFF